MPINLSYIYSMNTNTKNYEIKLLNISQLASAIFIVTSLVAMYITQDQILEIKQQTRLLNNNKAYQINLINRITVIGILLTFCWINNENIKIAKIKNKKLRPFQLQLTASSITLVASFIILYVLIINRDLPIAQVENPNF